MTKEVHKYAWIRTYDQYNIWNVYIYMQHNFKQTQLYILYKKLPLKNLRQNS
jgi:hypothetical protein